MAVKQSIRDVDMQGKRVLVRVDFNVPLNQDLQITDDTRIRAALPTIRCLLDQGAAVILASHLGRPKGKVVQELRLRPAAERLSDLLDMEVTTVSDSIGPEIERLAARLKPGQVLMLENLRFHPEEEANDGEYARRLAALADFYVDDAFGSAHRAHASTEGITHYLPAVAGLLMERELQALGGALAHPERPFVVIIGGAKISSKIDVLRNLLDVADAYLIGGGMANTLLKAQGIDVAASLVEDDKLDVAGDFLAEAERRGREVHLPIDAVVAATVKANAENRTVSVNDVPEGWSIVDIGPQTEKLYGRVIGEARTVLWNGPMGVFEVEAFSSGTRAVADLLAHSNATTIVGGGDSVAAVEQAGLSGSMSHVSTGGGATLEFLEGRSLPGVAALMDARP